MSDWIKKQDGNICSLQEVLFKCEGMYAWKKLGKIYCAHSNQKKAETAILIPDKAEFRARKIISIRQWNKMIRNQIFGLQSWDAWS